MSKWKNIDRLLEWEIIWMPDASVCTDMAERIRENTEKDKLERIVARARQNWRTDVYLIFKEALWLKRK